MVVGLSVVVGSVVVGVVVGARVVVVISVVVGSTVVVKVVSLSAVVLSTTVVVDGLQKITIISPEKTFYKRMYLSVDQPSPSHPASAG